MIDNKLSDFCSIVQEEIVENEDEYTIKFLKTDPLFEGEVINVINEPSIKAPYEYTIVTIIDLEPRANLGHEHLYVLFNLMNPEERTVFKRSMPPEDYWTPMVSCKEVQK